MKSRTKPLRKFVLRISHYGSYIDQIYRLEAIIAKGPARLQIDMAGAGEIPADAALWLRSVLLARKARTRVVTNARSGLHGASVLIWLLGDTRLVRSDAQLFFRRANPFNYAEKDDDHWKNVATDDEGLSDEEVEEGDYIRVLRLINEFLPVKELAGRPIDISVLRQFGLVDNEKVDRFLAGAFAKVENQPVVKRQPRNRIAAESKIPPT